MSLSMVGNSKAKRLSKISRENSMVTQIDKLPAALTSYALMVGDLKIGNLKWISDCSRIDQARNLRER
jgi:hypothetical protein